MVKWHGVARVERAPWVGGMLQVLDVLLSHHDWQTSNPLFSIARVLRCQILLTNLVFASITHDCEIPAQMNGHNYLRFKNKWLVVREYLEGFRDVSARLADLHTAYVLHVDVALFFHSVIVLTSKVTSSSKLSINLLERTHYSSQTGIPQCEWLNIVTLAIKC